MDPASAGMLMLVPSIAFWLLMGYFGGLIFAKKGYPPGIGISIGVLFGPCTLVVCLLLPRTKAGFEQSKLEHAINTETKHQFDTKACPGCGRKLGFSAKICPRCDYRYDE